MTDRYTTQFEKFDLIATILKDIYDLNAQLDHRDGFGDYTHRIACAHRTCALGIEFWTSICMNSQKACEFWDTLDTSSDQFQSLRLKLAMLRIILDNFQTTADDRRYWKLTNNTLLFFESAGENPPSTEAPAPVLNPAAGSGHTTTNPHAPHAQLVHMLMRLKQLTL